MTYKNRYSDDMPDLSKTPNLDKFLRDFLLPDIGFVEEDKEHEFYMGGQKIKLYKKKEKKDENFASTTK